MYPTPRNIHHLFELIFGILNLFSQGCLMKINGRGYCPEGFRTITSYCPERFRTITSYCPEVFRRITSYCPEPLSNVCKCWLAMPLDASFLRWVLACRTIERKKWKWNLIFFSSRISLVERPYNNYLAQFVLNILYLSWQEIVWV